MKLNFCFKITPLLLIAFSLFTYSSEQAEACDIAVVSAQASSTGRPFIWKNRDDPMRWEQEIKYYEEITPEAGSYLCIIDRTGLVAIPSGGVNQAGLAIANTTVYESNPLHEYLANANTDLMIYALQHCTTVEDFDDLLVTWREIPSSSGKVISGNFVVIDAHGGAALYEAYTGEGSGAYAAPIMFEKFDANTATDNDGNPVGFVNRTNSHQWIMLKNDSNREVRGDEILHTLSLEGDLNHVNAMRILSRDINKWDYENHHRLKETGENLSEAERQSIENNQDMIQVNTEYSISRAETNIALVVDGVQSGGDPRLSTFWANMGEPSIGVFTPHFTASEKLTYFVWADNLFWKIIPRNLSPACLLNQLFVYNGELSMYDNNGWIVEQIDWTVNYSKLRNLQSWTFPLEDIIISRTEEFLADISDDTERLTADNLYEFSHYCARFAYKNYSNKACDAFLWSFEKPWGGTWTGKKRPDPLSDDNPDDSGDDDPHNPGDDPGNDDPSNPGDDTGNNDPENDDDDFYWDDSTSDGNSSYSSSSGTSGCGSAAHASVYYNGNNDKLSEIFSLLFIMLFPLSVIFLRKMIKRRVEFQQ